METLFEYGEQISVPDRKSLQEYLISVWLGYKNLWSVQSDDLVSSTNKNYQPFLLFDGEFAKANNFIGFIKTETVNIEIYPKVFGRMANKNKELMHRHLFYWFSYCKKIKFPFNQNSLNTFEIEQFPELIIYLTTQQISLAVHSQPYLTYEEVEEALATPRGKISFDRYTKSLSYGSYHLVDCDYEPFVFDNMLNRVIKYCVRLLLTQTNLPDTQRELNEIIFLLDEVEDHVYTVSHLDRIKLTSAFDVYSDVIESCKMILQNQIYSYSEYQMKNWSLLLPMELIFEDFISGFIKDHFSSHFSVHPQKSELYLHEDPYTFNLQHDILLTHRTSKEKIIIDTKYKPRWNLSPADNKKGVFQSDMYQMISYAYRRGTDKVILIYPNTSKILSEDYTFIVKKPDGKEEIKIKIIDVPFWSELNHLEIEEALKRKLEATLLNEF